MLQSGREQENKRKLRKQALRTRVSRLQRREPRGAGTCGYVSTTAKPRPMVVPLQMDANMDDTCTRRRRVSGRRRRVSGRRRRIRFHKRSSA